MSKVDKIMVTGDWHGNTPWAVNVIKVAAKHGIRKIFNVGDFGIWTHDEDGIGYLDTMNAEARKHGVKIYFVRGNHENKIHLDWWEKHNPRTWQGHVIVRSHIFYVLDGTRWMWNDKWFMGVGGAVSIDKDWRLANERKPSTLWWAGEETDERAVFALEQRNKHKQEKTDYLFTHDCPTNAPFKFRLKNDPKSHMNRQIMDRLGKAVKPKMWFHGHMHDKFDGYDFPAYNAHTSVYGLECDGMAWNWGVLDTKNDSFTWNAEFVRVNPDSKAHHSDYYSI